MARLGYLLAFLLGMAAAIAIQGHTQSWVIGSGLAFHLDGGKHCNDHVTPGFGVETKGYAVGLYSNSNCKTSAYAAKFWTPIQYGAVKLGTLAGLVSGYSYPILPVAGLVASWEGAVYKLNLILIPPAGSSGNVLWIQVGTRW